MNAISAVKVLINHFSIIVLADVREDIAHRLCKDWNAFLYEVYEILGIYLDGCTAQQKEINEFAILPDDDPFVEQYNE